MVGGLKESNIWYSVEVAGNEPLVRTWSYVSGYFHLTDQIILLDNFFISSKLTEA